MRKFIYFFGLIVAFGLLFGNHVLSQTPDGETPAMETVCEGQVGAAFGLCNAYCEAMDCDSDAPQASAKACAKVGGKFENFTGEMPPCEVTQCPCDGLTSIGATWSDEYPVSICQQGTHSSGFTNFQVLDQESPQIGSLQTGVVALQDGGGEALGCSVFALDPVPGMFNRVEPITEEEHVACIASLRQIANNDGIACPN